MASVLALTAAVTGLIAVAVPVVNVMVGFAFRFIG